MCALEQLQARRAARALVSTWPAPRSAPRAAKGTDVPVRSAGRPIRPLWVQCFASQAGSVDVAGVRAGGAGVRQAPAGRRHKVHDGCPCSLCARAALGPCMSATPVTHWAGARRGPSAPCTRRGRPERRGQGGRMARGVGAPGASAQPGGASNMHCWVRARWPARAWEARLGEWAQGGRGAHVRGTH